MNNRTFIPPSEARLPGAQPFILSWPRRVLLGALLGAGFGAIAWLFVDSTIAVIAAAFTIGGLLGFGVKSFSSLVGPSAWPVLWLSDRGKLK